MAGKQTIFLNTVEPQETKWLWEPFIPLGKLTIIQGDPGCGKSTLALNIAAAVTQGRAFPDMQSVVTCGEMVLYQNAEDGLADTIRPRLDAAGADVRMVFTLDESQERLSFCDTELLHAIQIHRPRLVVLDPLQAYMGGYIDMHRANEVRPVLAMLSGIAERYQCAIVLIGHMNKMGGQSALYRGMGSIDIAAAARSVLLVAKHPQDSSKRVVMQIKNSLAEMPKPQAFTLRDRKVHWLGDCDVTEAQLLSQPTEDHSALSRAILFLKEHLNAETPELPAHQLEALARAEGISKATLFRAKEQLRIKSLKRESRYFWMTREHFTLLRQPAEQVDFTELAEDLPPELAAP